jgi:hypothetical protein
LVKRIFSSYTQRPSSVKEWQIPLGAALPSRPPRFSRQLPLEAQETSYLAALARIPIFPEYSYGEDHQRISDRVMKPLL